LHVIRRSAEAGKSGCHDASIKLPPDLDHISFGVSVRHTTGDETDTRNAPDIKPRSN
jgi:hypothetical protein